MMSKCQAPTYRFCLELFKYFPIIYNMKKLKTFNDLMEARVLKSYLESNGIHVILKEGNATGLFPQFNEIEGIELWVEDDQYENAKEIINSS